MYNEVEPSDTSQNHQNEFGNIILANNAKSVSSHQCVITEVGYALYVQYK